MSTDEMYGAAAAGFGIGYFIFMLVIYAALVVGYWKTFEKAGVPGWMSIIPFLNFYQMFKISMGNGWLFFLLFIPCVNFVFEILMLINMNKAFGQSGAMVILGIFLTPIYFMVLGFGSAQYIGPKGEPAF